MKISSKEIPQADKLSDVMKVVEGVYQGARTFQELARLIAKGDRQGRYYRPAAELLGFITSKANYAELTPLGEKYVTANKNQRNKILAKAVLSTRVTQRLVPFFEIYGKDGVSRKQIETFVGSVTQSADSTVHRRTSSIIKWLSDIGILQQHDSNFVLGSLPESVDLIDYAAEDEPLFPMKHDLSEYQDLSSEIRQNTKSISILIDEAQKDRALKSHKMLTNLMAEKVRKAGAIPKRNPYIDLSARIDEHIYLFEMKSSNDKNAHEQIRKGISQLYEYRYIQRIHEARLVLVVENPLPRRLRWLENYLGEDRGIFFVWDGDRKNFNCPKGLKKKMAFIFQ